MAICKDCMICGAKLHPRGPQLTCSAVCSREHMRKYFQTNRNRINEWRRQNRERINERKRTHYAVNRESLCERKREYRRANREHTRMRDREYYAANRERISEQNRKCCAKYQKANREKLRETSRQACLAYQALKSLGITLDHLPTSNRPWFAYKVLRQHFPEVLTTIQQRNRTND